MLLIQIRNIDVESIDLEEAVAALACTKMIAAEYNNMKVPAPGWLIEKLDALQANVKTRHRDYLLKALKSANQKRDALKTREERLTSVNSEIANLEDALKG